MSRNLWPISIWCPFFCEYEFIIRFHWLIGMKGTPRLSITHYSWDLLATWRWTKAYNCNYGVCHDDLPGPFPMHSRFHDSMRSRMRPCMHAGLVACGHARARARARAYTSIHWYTRTRYRGMLLLIVLSHRCLVRPLGRSNHRSGRVIPVPIPHSYDGIPNAALARETDIRILVDGWLSSLREKDRAKTLVPNSNLALQFLF